MHLLLRLHIRLVTLAIPLLDRWLPLPRLVRLLIAGPKWQPYRRVPVATISVLVHAALRRPRWMKRRACYRLGLTMGHFLRLAGQPVLMHFAVAPPSMDPRRLHAHCWVTVNGEDITAPSLPGTHMRTFVQFSVDNETEFRTMFVKN